MFTSIFTTTNFKGDQMFRFSINGKYYHYQFGYPVAALKGEFIEKNHTLWGEVEAETADEVVAHLQVTLLMYQEETARKDKAERMSRLEKLGYTGAKAELIEKANVIYVLESQKKLESDNQELLKKLAALKADNKAMKEGFKSHNDKLKFYAKKSKEAAALRLQEMVEALKKAKAEGNKYVAIKRNWSVRAKGYKSFLGCSYEFRSEKPATKDFYTLKTSKKFAQQILNITSK